MSYKIIIFRLIVIILLIIAFILNCYHDTEAIRALFNTVYGIIWGIVIYDTINYMEDWK